MQEPRFARFYKRLFARRLPPLGEMEAYGARGEEVIYRKLREGFDCVIRNVILPEGDGYLEKDFLVIHNGVPVVIEVKFWKGMISVSPAGDRFYQDKYNGEHKELKSPVFTTRRFLSSMQSFYGLETPPLGMVVFADPDCDLDLPAEMGGIALVTGGKMLAAIRDLVKRAPKPQKPLDPETVLHCSRLYAGGNRSFCKGLITDEGIPCYTTGGQRVSLNPLYLRYISLDHQPLLLRDKMTVTFVNDSAAVFYNHTAVLTLLCLDGTVIRVPLSKLSTVIL